MGTDPEPDGGLAIDDGKRAVPKPNACRKDGLRRVDVLEAEARMVRIVLEASVSLTGTALNMLRQPSVRLAKTSGGL